MAAFYAALLTHRLPRGVSQMGARGTDLVIGEPVVWSLTGGRIDGPDVGMGGVGSQWAAARADIGLAWAFLTNAMGGSERAEEVEAALLECVDRCSG